MQELTIEETAEVNGARKGKGSLSFAFEVGYQIGNAINWLMDNSHTGQGNLPPEIRAGRE